MVSCCKRCRCFATLRQLRQIRRYVPTSTFQKLVVALVHFRLDYGNGVLVSIPVHLMCRLQSVLNAIWNVPTTSQMHSSAFTGCGLRVPERIQYKIAVLSYKVLHDTVPWYLEPLTRVADIRGWWALCSASTDRLEVPYFKLSTIGDRAFPVAASQIWKLLPETVVSASTTLRSFQHQLKTCLFQRSFIH